MALKRRLVLAPMVLAAAFGGSAAIADIVVDYAIDAGGSNNNPLNGLSARATFTLTKGGTGLCIKLQNTSTGLPDGFDTAASLLVSLGMNLGVDFASGDSAVIGAGSTGLGKWSNLGAGDSVADEWVFSNSGAGDLLQGYAQVITTSSGLGGAAATHFSPGSGNIGGPFGGIAADPVLKSIPGNQRAVSDSILFDLTLASGITEGELRAALEDSIVEFGSDVQYLTPKVVIPAPGAALLGILGLAALRRAAR